RPRRAQSCLDIGERRARRGPRRAARRGVGQRRLHVVPLARVVSRSLSALAQPDRVDRRPQAPRHSGVSARQQVKRHVNVRLYILQRATAAIMAPLVLLHIAVIFYANHKGISAADILARTRGSVAWALFYGVFVLAVATHASIGVRTILTEWSPIR